MEKFSSVNCVLGFIFAILVYLPLIGYVHVPKFYINAQYNTSIFPVITDLEQSLTNGNTLMNDDGVDTTQYQTESNSIESKLGGSTIYRDSYHTVKGSKCHPTQLDFSSTGWFE